METTTATVEVTAVETKHATEQIALSAQPKAEEAADAGGEAESAQETVAPAESADLAKEGDANAAAGEEGEAPTQDEAPGVAGSDEDAAATSATVTKETLTETVTTKSTRMETDVVMEEVVTKEVVVATEKLVAEAAAATTDDGAAVEMAADTSTTDESETQTSEETTVAKDAVDKPAVEDVVVENTAVEGTAAASSTDEQAAIETLTPEAAVGHDAATKETEPVKAKQKATALTLALSKQAAEEIADAMVDDIIAEAIAFVEVAVEIEAQPSHAIVSPVLESEEAAAVTVEASAVDEDQQSAVSVEATVSVLADSVAIDTEAAHAMAEERAEATAGPPEPASAPLDEPKADAEALASSHSLSSDDEGWRSDDTDDVDGGDASTKKQKKKSRAFRSPVSSMISRFANKVSGSMPKKKLGAHRTESAAKLDLVTPSPVQGAVKHLETHHEAKLETHRTESASMLDLDGSSPVKHIVNRFESPQHNSLDGLKIRTVRTFFDEKERSIHVGKEKEKYDSVLKSAAGGEASTPKKSSPTAAKTAQSTPKTVQVATPASPAPPTKAVEASASVEANASTGRTNATPVKNMVSRFEKKPEQSLDNLSFRTVRDFFPTNAEPSIRVGAEKQKYDAVTEQQKLGVRRQEEGKLAKKKVAEAVVAEVDTAPATAATASKEKEEEHVLHVRDLAHQLEARSSLTRDLAPVSLSRSSSNASERNTRSSSGAHTPVDMAPVRLGRSTSTNSDRSSVGAAAGVAAAPALARSASSSSDRPPRFVARSQSDVSSHHGDGDEFHVKDVAQRFESRLAPSPLSARRASGTEVTLGVAHSELRRASEPPIAQALAATTSEDEVFHVKDIAHRFEAKKQSPVAGRLSRQSSGADATASAAAAATPPRFRRDSSHGSESSAPATPTMVQVASNAVLETGPSANVRDIAHRFETNRTQSVETPAYRTMETFFDEVDAPSIRVRAEKAKLEALEKQKEQEAKLAWARSLRAEEEAAAAAAAAAKTETLDWFLMPAATNPALVRLHAVLADRDPMTSLALFPRQDQAAAEADSDLVLPLIPMDLPPFA